ncbi:hypothetical protein CEUSTIGMA_g10536.t1 [Chlamydomonas eustigma]|uniref:Uncharacterized protein n=1 Tax=Chlamydomonas eustigma TaxID=1157962 RepID=A0A250XJX9_9CHLO|nr:hypothetical protein CEUSTIGMA_g10536.t1 [Chlamydomonas eustigma]|eukprot:GAX83110.1 hypothetical protein CEUSTIGMA_g10536.t1 [Chlamydomonas eustigma]
MGGSCSKLLHSARAYISKFSKEIYTNKTAYLFLMLSAKRDKQHFVDLSTGIEACVNHLMRMNQVMSQMSCSHDYHNDMRDLAVEVAKVTGSEENVLAGFRKLLLEND